MYFSSTDWHTAENITYLRHSKCNFDYHLMGLTYTQLPSCCREECWGIFPMDMAESKEGRKKKQQNHTPPPKKNPKHPTKELPKQNIKTLLSSAG